MVSYNELKVALIRPSVWMIFTESNAPLDWGKCKARRWTNSVAGQQRSVLSIEEMTSTIDNKHLLRIEHRAKVVQGGTPRCFSGNGSSDRIEALLVVSRCPSF